MAKWVEKKILSEYFKAIDENNLQVGDILILKEWNRNLKYRRSIMRRLKTMKKLQKKIKSLEIDNKRLHEENEMLKKNNKTFEIENKRLIADETIAKLIASNINKENVYKLIESLFEKTFDESTYDCPDFWYTFVNYYNNRADIIALLKYAGIRIPSEIETIILPHEWNEELLDKFFDTMLSHHNQDSPYKENLRFWKYRMAAKPFENSKYIGCDEIPWQFVLRNPLLNTKNYALKIVKAMNDGGNGLKFSEICTYQKLSEEILTIIVDGLEVNDKTREGELVDFLEKHIEMVKEKCKLDYLYPIIASKWKRGNTILKMPKEYQIKYAKSLKELDEKIQFLKKTQLSKEEKIEVIGEMS